MSALTSLIIFCALAAFSLIVVSVANEREKRKQVLSKKFKELRQYIHETEELILEIDQLSEDHTVAKLMNNEIIEMILAMKNANPGANYLDASYQTAIARADTLNDSTIEAPLDRLKESDTQIARAQKVIEEAAIALRRQQNAGKISLEDMNQLLIGLNWAHLMVEVVSHIGQGHKAVRRNDILSAHAFYKKAQQMLMQSSHPDKRRHPFIKELSEIMANNRRAISTHIMPESHLNPEEPPTQNSPPTPEENQVSNNELENDASG